APGQSATTHPAASHPAAGHPAASQPAVGQSAATGSATGDPTADRPTSEQPLTEQSLTERPPAEQPFAEQPFAEAPPGEQPLGEQHLGEQALGEQSLGETSGPGVRHLPSQRRPAASEEQLPELPFTPDVWGQRASASLDLPTPPHGSPALPPGAFKQHPFQIPPPPPPKGAGRSKKALFATLGALALAGVATGGFFAYKAVSAPAPTAQAGAQQPSSTPSASEPATVPPPELSGAAMLNSEETDPRKLALSEAFPQKKVSAADASFSRLKTDVEASCEKAAAGTFADALRAQDCSRVLRATYVDSKRKYAVTTGIAVLPTKDAALQADQAKDLSRNVWFRGLPAERGSGGERVHIAGGYAAGLVWGRYIVFSYATYADGHTPKAKDKTLDKISDAFRDQLTLVLERRVAKGG
ncbi:hypothetical protein HII36_55085, partial [Nonomuraea sp. NN258]|uniref:hypothetical protein n=1 Tax=Nonomuraea antri TaxID=2730852 RepID=UPI0015693222